MWAVIPFRDRHTQGTSLSAEVGVQSAHFRGHGGPTDGPAVLSLEDGMCWRGFWLFFLICKSDHMVSTELCCSN